LKTAEQLKNMAFAPYGIKGRILQGLKSSLRSFVCPGNLKANKRGSSEIAGGENPKDDSSGG